MCWQDIYAVNAIVFHKLHGTFCTGERRRRIVRGR